MRKRNNEGVVMATAFLVQLCFPLLLVHREILLRSCVYFSRHFFLWSGCALGTTVRGTSLLLYVVALHLRVSVAGQWDRYEISPDLDERSIGRARRSLCLNCVNIFV
jgi:hypothetical protein